MKYPKSIEEIKLEDCLFIDPFAGDFGDNEFLFGDNIVKAAKEHKNKCFCCGGTIKKHEQHRALREAHNKKAITTRWCYDCCIAMAKSLYDSGKEWEARIQNRST